MRYRLYPGLSTGYSPNFLILGKENRAPLDLIFGLTDIEADVHNSYDSFVYNYQQRSRQSYHMVREHLQQAAERSKKDYDMRVRPVLIKE